MTAKFVVTGATNNSNNAANTTTLVGRTRYYYIAAEEVMWNYTPYNSPLPKGAEWLQSGPDRIGAVNKKSVYVEYTDSTFQTRKEVPPQWAHKGKATQFFSFLSLC